MVVFFLTDKIPNKGTQIKFSYCESLLQKKNTLLKLLKQNIKLEINTVIGF